MSCSLRRGWRKCRTLWTGGCRWTGANSSPCTGCGSNASTARVQFSPLRPRTEPEERNPPELDLPSTRPGAEIEVVLPCFTADVWNWGALLWLWWREHNRGGLTLSQLPSCWWTCVLWRGCIPREARATISHFVLMSSVIWERAGYPEINVSILPEAVFN